METKYSRYRRRLRVRLVSALGGRCRKEGCAESRPERLEFAHLEPTEVVGRGRGKCRRLFDVKNNPDKYTLLCRPHHVELDGLHPNWTSEPPMSDEDAEEYRDYHERRYGHGRS